MEPKEGACLSMFAGFFLIFLGILILAEPRILVVALAGTLMAGGVTMVLISWRLRRLYRDANQQFGEGWKRFFIRF